MSQDAILGIMLIPAGLFWLTFTLGCEPASRLKGHPKDIVVWLINFTVQATTTLALILLVVAFLLSFAAFFGFSELQAKNWVKWYFASFFSVIILQALTVFIFKMFLLNGKKNKLIE